MLQCCIQKMYLEGAYTNFSRFRGGGYVTAANSNYRNFAWGGGPVQLRGIRRCRDVVGLTVWDMVLPPRVHKK